jgi:hypothetical protein
VFLDHFLRVNDKKGANNLYVINLITKINFEYNQATVPSTVGSVIRFGDSYVASGINDQTHYNKMYNKLD